MFGLKFGSGENELFIFHMPYQQQTKVDFLGGGGENLGLCDLFFFSIRQAIFFAERNARKKCHHRTHHIHIRSL